MHQTETISLPLVYLDDDKTHRISDDGEQWVIESRARGVYVTRYEHGPFEYPRFGSSKSELILCIREEGIPISATARGLLAVFWDHYADYEREILRVRYAELLDDLHALARFAEPLDENLLLPSREFRGGCSWKRR